MNRLRAIDRIDVGPRFTEQDAIRLNRMFRGTETEEWLRAVIEGNLVGDTAVVSSFGAESAVLLHLIAQVDSTVPVLFLDTVKPLEKALANFDASFTGRKAFQSATRANLPRFEVDSADVQGRLKINPLIDWSAEDIAAYFETHDLPRHPLVDRGFPSIGCSPCTRQVGEGEDPRAGRWSGWDKVECGIHKPGEEPFL